MTVLVTGAAGFLGAAALRAVRGQGGAAIGTSRGGGDDLLACDLGDAAAIAALLDRVRPAAIINNAAVADFGAGALARQYGPNAVAPAIMAQWAARSGALLVQVSGTLVHGKQATHFGPALPDNPDNDYAISKWLAERMVQASGCAHAIVRFGGIYGRGGPAHLGLNRAITAAAESGTVPTVFGSGAARRNYIHVDDAAAMLADCAVNRRQGLFWAGGPEILSIRQMLQTVCDVFIPGAAPVMAEGGEAPDQIVETSPGLPLGRSMADALAADR